MENTKVDLINSIVELSDALQILIVLAADNKTPDYLKYENKAADILKQQYGAFSLYFNEIRHTRDIEELYRVMGDYLSHLERNSSDSNMLLYCLPWINVYGHNGYITEKPPFVDIWEATEQTAEPEQHTEPQRSVPEELTTPEAKKILRRGITAGLLNEDDYQAKQGVTRAQQKEFADLASQVLKISNKWVVFGTLWGIKHLAQVKTTDARPETLMAVRKLFQELGFDMDGKPINKKGKFI